MRYEFHPEALDRYVFQHSFGSGFSCAVAFQPAIHYDRATNSIRPAKQGSPEPSEEDFHAFYPQYVEWMHTVNTHLSEIIGGDHTYVFQDSYADEPFWEFWVYHANGEKEWVTKQSGFFDPCLIGR